MPKFKVRDKVIIKKYNNNGEIMPYWISSMDDLDGQIMTIINENDFDIQGETRSRGYLLVFHPDWCEKVEKGHIEPSEKIINKTQPIKPNFPEDRIEKGEELPDYTLEVEEAINWEQREYDLYISLINKYIDQIMSGEEVLIRNCRGMAKQIISEFKK